MDKKTISRRDFLKVMGTMMGATALASCAQATPETGGAGTEAILTGTVIRTCQMNITPPGTEEGACSPSRLAWAHITAVCTARATARSSSP